MTPYTATRLRELREVLDALDVNVHVIVDDEVVGCVVLVLHRDAMTITECRRMGREPWYTELIPARALP